MDNAIIMEYTKLLERKAELEKALSKLPQGYISNKSINGKTYQYLQSRVAGKMTGEYLKKDKAGAVAEQLRLRKQYEAELPGLNTRLGELERAARLIGHGLDRRMNLIKLGMGMMIFRQSRKNAVRPSQMR